jgi:uncharacterized membrane protein
MSAPKPAERLLLFTDAVVAIAITLLILPLLDAVTEAAAAHAQPTDVITENLPRVYSFLLSFAVISRLWLVHHDVFGTVKSLNRPLIQLDLCWLLTIVVLPFQTAMVGSFQTNRFVTGLYIGTILVSNICQTLMILIMRAHPELLHDPDEARDRFVPGALGTMLALVVAFLLAVFVPGVSYYGLLLLLLVAPVIRLFKRRPVQAQP